MDGLVKNGCIVKWIKGHCVTNKKLYLVVYLRGVTEYVLNLILPSEDFSNPLFRSLAQDLIAEQILLPTAHYCTTSYFVNSTVVSLVQPLHNNLLIKYLIRLKTLH